MHKPSSKSGYLSANLTFWGLNMATKRPHSKGERTNYQWDCWPFTQGAEGQHLIHKNVI